ncbi:thiamine phosphate synthase [Sphingomonas colocasiae]|nr:thiamine phosphate synthase [Sphingomonas colocasiae]
MTDERQGDALWDALETMPRDGGIVFRHYSLDPTARRAVFEQVRHVARRRGLMLLLAGPPSQARIWGADGAHGRFSRIKAGTMILSAPVHDGAELRRARHADLIFVSPVFATRSHPGVKGLGMAGFRPLLAQSGKPVIALGGMNARRAERVMKSGAYGWAAIDGLTPR